MADPNLGEIAASVWDNKIGGKPSDNIFNSRALMARVTVGASCGEGVAVISPRAASRSFTMSCVLA